MIKKAFLILLILAAFLSLNELPHSDNLHASPPRVHKERSKENAVPVVTLETSESPLETTGPTSALFTSRNDGQTVYVVNGETGEVEARKSEPGVSPRRFASTFGPMAVRSREYFAYLDKDSKVVFAEPNGRFLGQVYTPPAISLDFLSNGNIVVASPTKDNTLHIYTPGGRLLRRFGATKKRRSIDPAENQFLHKGKVLCDAADNIYYVYYYIPLIQKFTPTGELEREIEVSGAAVDIQQEVAEEFFKIRTPEEVGGVSIITAASIDPKTGHLWIGLNGSSSSAVVYEYDAAGIKVAEYALQVNSPYTKELITGVRDIAVTASKVFVATNQYQLFQFDKVRSSDRRRTSRVNRTVQKNGYSIRTVAWKSSAAAKPVLDPQGGCGTAQTWAACGFSCPAPACEGTTPTATSSNSAQLDCKTALENSLSPPYVVINSNCTQYPAGTAMHMRGGCMSFVRICKAGQNSDHNLTIDCQAPICTGGGGGGGCEAEPGACDSGCSWSFSECCCLCGGSCNSPIVIDVLGNGFNLTDGNGGVYFDINKDTVKEHLSWTRESSDDAFLALDRNGNGTIDDGGELFGNFTSQPLSSGGNGFLALAEFDKPTNGGNNDDKIDRRDAIFSSLRLWQDSNHDGISQGNELHTLPSLGLASIDLDYKDSRRRDQYGNFFRYCSKMRDVRGAQLGGWAWDVFLVAAR